MGTMWPWGGAYFERLFRSPNQNRKFRVRKFPTFCAVQSPLQSTQDGRVTRGRQRYLLLSVRLRAGKVAPCDVTGAKILLTPRSARLQVLFARPRSRPTLMVPPT